MKNLIRNVNRTIMGINNKNLLENKASNFLLVFVTFLIVIICIEFGLHIIAFVADINPNIDRSLRTYFKEKPWGRAYLKELDEVFANFKYVPFLEWQSKEYRGRYIYIDSAGRRRTWNTEDGDKILVEKIFIFGGSTVWGEGARDEFTIPSYLSKILNKNGNKYIVSNYGESAYIFEQELIRLFLLLRAGHRPNYVIFYDGSNDVYAAYQSRGPGTILDMSRIQEKLEANSLRLIWSTVTDVFSRRCFIYKGMYRLYGMTYPNISQRTLSANEEANIEILSSKIVKDYMTSKQVLDQLSRVYDFKYVCFWQPVVFTEAQVNQDDAFGDPRLTDKSLAKLYQYTNTSLMEHPVPDFFNLSNVLCNRTERYYIDFVHLTEGGNEIVAKRISQIFLKKFASE